ncbi:hypothetical protein DFH11DRAFT_1614237 [Phellopilus nigrolimitatus]|nr:hypothetical protein DFH11DRAFT_1614237 [Phellopilus nigrolimitatus]
MNIRRSFTDGRNINLRVCFGRKDIEDLARIDEEYRGLPRREELEGTVIPTYLGFYSGKDERLGEIGCIVMEDCGENIGTTETLPLGIQEKLCGLLKALHDFRLHHVDFSTHKVVERDGKYRIIGYDSLEQRDCQWDGNWHIGEEIPDIDEFNCNSLHAVGEKLRIWKPVYVPSVMIGGREFENDDDFFPEQRVIDALLQNVDTHHYTSIRKYIRWLMTAKEEGVWKAMRVSPSTRNQLQRLKRPDAT